MIHFSRRFASVVVFALVFPCFAVAGVLPVGLHCESTGNPLGIDAQQPNLSWLIEASGTNPSPRGVKQTAYQILVAVVWDSGKVASDQSQNVGYGGKPLVSGLRYDWKVRVWDQDGKASEWSKPATWTMGTLKPEVWTTTYPHPYESLNMILE